MQQEYEENWPNLSIKYLILASEKYIVFIDHENDIDWATKADYDHVDIDKHNAIMNKAALLECIPCNHFEDKIIVNFKRMIGEAYCRSFKHDYSNAEAMLGYAQTFIEARNAEQSRSWYLSATGVTTLAFVCSGMLVWIFRKNVIPIVGKFAFVLFIATVAGSLGAFLSVVMRMGTSRMDSAAGKKLHYLEGSLKVISGAVSAILLGLAVNAEIIVPAFSKLKKTYLAMILVGFIAGGSERWAPSIINKVSGTKDDEDKQITGK